METNITISGDLGSCVVRWRTLELRMLQQSYYLLGHIIIYVALRVHTREDDMKDSSLELMAGEKPPQ